MAAINSTWKIQSLRLSTFFGSPAGIPIGDFDSLSNGKATRQERDPNTGISKGSYQDGQRLFTRALAGNRLDWTVEPAPTTSPKFDFPDIGSHDDIPSIMDAIADEVFNKSKDIQRVAFGAILSMELPKIDFWIDEIGKRLPMFNSENLKGHVPSDFGFHHNIREIFKIDKFGDLEINRLAKWSAGEFVSMILAIPTSGAGLATQSVGSTFNAITVELDLNNNPLTSKLLNGAQASVFYRKLTTVARELVEVGLR